MIFVFLFRAFGHFVFCCLIVAQRCVTTREGVATMNTEDAVSLQRVTEAGKSELLDIITSVGWRHE